MVGSRTDGEGVAGSFGSVWDCEESGGVVCGGDG